MVEIVSHTAYYDPSVSVLLQKSVQVVTLLVPKGEPIIEGSVVTNRGSKNVVTLVVGSCNLPQDVVQYLQASSPKIGDKHLPFISRDEIDSYGAAALTRLSAIRTKYVTKKGNNVVDELRTETPDQKYYGHIFAIQEGQWVPLAK